MIMLSSFIPFLQAQDWFVALDLQDMYYHTGILPAHRKYLRFTMGPNHYQYNILLFGVSTTSRVFMKCLPVVPKRVRKKGIHIYLYLNDWLIRGISHL